VIYTWKDISQISKLIKQGKCCICETDTVMGIISLKEEDIYKYKQRDLSKKVSVFISKIKQIPNFPSKYQKIIKKYWPGALSIIFNDINYRIPNHKNLLKLIKKVGVVYQSSANISGKPPVKSSIEAKEVFKDYLNDIVIIEGQELGGQPSTIISLDDFKVVRNGPIDGNEVLNAIKHK